MNTFVAYMNQNNNAWGYSLLFVTLINLLAACGAVLQKCMKYRKVKFLLLFLMSFAVGVLSANAIVSLIPTGFRINKPEDGNKDHLYGSITILAGLFVFSLVEVIIKISSVCKSKKNGSKLSIVRGVHIHPHYADEVKIEVMSSSNNKDVIELLDAEVQEKERISQADVPKLEENDRSLQPSPENIDSKEELYVDNNNNKIISVKKTANEKKSSRFYSPICLNYDVPSYASLIIFGDAVHNFIDGLAIGSTFSKSISSGVSTAVAVMCEEFPHELGDFAALLTAGFNVQQALFWNLVSSLTCYFGTVIGLLLGNVDGVTEYIELFCGGIFIYISFVGILPEVLEEATILAQNNVSKIVWNTVLVFFGIFSGMAFMVGMDFVVINIGNLN